VDLLVRRLFEHTTRADTLLACTRDELLKVVEALKSIAVQAGADVRDYHGPARPRKSSEFGVLSSEGGGKPVAVRCRQGGEVA
jgi:hypothetical protein